MAKMKEKDALQKNKKTLLILKSSEASPLSNSELLVYCYHVYQYKFKSIPSFRQTAKNVGLKQETVSKAVAALVSHGLLTSDYAVIDPCPRKDWFAFNEKLWDPDEEFSFHSCEFWRTFIRQPGEHNPLSVAAVMVYSYLRHCGFSGFCPRNGWSYEYLARMVKVEPATVKVAIKKLQDCALLQIEEGFQFKLVMDLDEQQRSWISDASAPRTHAPEPVKFVSRREIDMATPVPVSTRKITRADLFDDVEERKEQTDRLRKHLGHNRRLTPGQRDVIFNTLTSDPNFMKKLPYDRADEMAKQMLTS